MSKDQNNKKQKLPGTHANNPVPALNLPNKEKGIKTLYSTDHKQ